MSENQSDIQFARLIENDGDFRPYPMARDGFAKDKITAALDGISSLPFCQPSKAMIDEDLIPVDELNRAVGPATNGLFVATKHRWR